MKLKRELKLLKCVEFSYYLIDSATGINSSNGKSACKVRWEFTPQEGDYRIGVITKEGGIITGTSDTGFSVKSNTIYTNQMSPLEQFKSGIPSSNVKCNDGLQLVIKAENSSPACVKPNTAKILFERGWAKTLQ